MKLKLVTKIIEDMKKLRSPETRKKVLDTALKLVYAGTEVAVVIKPGPETIAAKKCADVLKEAVEKKRKAASATSGN